MFFKVYIVLLHKCIHFYISFNQIHTYTYNLTLNYKHYSTMLHYQLVKKTAYALFLSKIRFLPSKGSYNLVPTPDLHKLAPTDVSPPLLH